MALSSSATKLQPTVAEQNKVRVQPKQAVATETDISSNPVAKIVLDPNAKDDQKVNSLLNAIDAESLQAVQTFGTYLAQHRTMMQRRLLELTSTTAFSRLQSVIGNLQNGVVIFENLMQPMNDDLQAAFELRTNGQMNNAIKQIGEDRAKEAEWETKRTQIKTDLAKNTRDVERLQEDIMALGENKTWFGNTTKAATIDIAKKTEQIERLVVANGKLITDEKALLTEQQEYAARTGGYKTQKERLRKMLDLGPGYVKKVEDIVNQAKKFIDDSTMEVGEVRGEFDGMGEQARNILTANAQTVRITAILDKAIDGACALHKQKVQALSVEPPDEDALARVTRTPEKNEVERFVSALTETAISTKKNVSALEGDAVVANDLNTVVRTQQNNLRELHGDGIASVTTNLNMALQAFNTAALTEAGNNAWQAIGDMNKVTDRIRDNQVVASAMSVDDTNKRIVDRFHSLEGVSEALREANKIRADGISNIASSLKELADKTAEVQRNLQVNIGLDASVDPTLTANATQEVAKKHDNLMLGLPN